VATAEDALAKFGNFQPDTLIADVELPGMTGWIAETVGRGPCTTCCHVITGKGSDERAWQRSKPERFGTSKSR